MSLGVINDIESLTPSKSIEYSFENASSVGNTLLLINDGVLAVTNSGVELTEDWWPPNPAE